MTTETATPANDAAAKEQKAAEPKAEQKPIEKTEEKPAEEQDPDLPMKVYAGNLSFDTNEEELEAHFTKIGKIKTVTIVRNGKKHLGYGFVTFETVTEAEKAVAELNKTTLKEREMNVQSARSKSDGKKKTRRQFRRRRGQKKKATEGEGEEKAEDTTEDGQKSEGATKRGRKRRARRGKGEQRQRGPPSTTTVFVANLPFSTTDESLQKAFTDAGLQVTTAYVVRGKGRYAERSKGFGFVELANQEQQTKAVEAMHGKTIEERPISVRVALEKVEDETPNGENDEQKDANGKVDKEQKGTEEVKTEADVKKETKETKA